MTNEDLVVVVAVVLSLVCESSVLLDVRHLPDAGHGLGRNMIDSLRNMKCVTSRELARL